MDKSETTQATCGGGGGQKNIFICISRVEPSSYCIKIEAQAYQQWCEKSLGWSGGLG